MFHAASADASRVLPPSLLLISGERVGGTLVAATLRARGHRVFVATDGAHGVARLLSAQEPISAVVIVGSLRDATRTPSGAGRAPRVRRAAVVSIGSDAIAEHEEPGRVLEVVAEDWPERAAEVSEWLWRVTAPPRHAATA